MMKKFFSSITLVALVGMMVAGLAQAATDNVTATVTVLYSAVSLDQSSFAYGSMNNDTASTTLPYWSGAGIEATTTGGTIDLDIYGANTTGGGTGWTLSTASSSNNYIHQFCEDTTDDCTTPDTNYVGNELTTSPQTLKSAVPGGTAINFQLRIVTPQTPTDFTEQSAVVTVQATAV
ncbi:MAG: hypothetical protein ABH881_03250 [bacterium]